MYMPKSTDEVNAKFPLIELGSIALHCMVSILLYHLPLIVFINLLCIFQFILAVVEKYHVSLWFDCV